MAIVELENGQKLEFEGEPTPQDIDSAIQQMGGSKETSQQHTPNDPLTLLGNLGRGAYQNPIVHALLKNPTAEEQYQTLPQANTLPQKLATMVGQAAPAIGLATPFVQAAGALPIIGSTALSAGAVGGLAYGEAERLAQQSEGQTENLTNPAMTAGQFALWGLLGQAGAGAVGSKAVEKIPFAGKVLAALPDKARLAIGSSLGGATAGALTSPEDERGTGALFGAGLGALNPSERFSAMRNVAVTLGPKKTADFMGKIFGPTVGEAVDKTLNKYGGFEEVAKVGQWENVAPDGTKQTSMDLAQGAREEGINKVHQALSPQFETVLSNLEQVKLGDRGKEILASLERDVNDIAEPPATSTLKAIWSKYQPYLYKTQVSGDIARQFGIKIPEGEELNLSALDKETASKIENFTKSLQKTSRRYVSIQDLPPQIAQQVQAEATKNAEVSPTALDRMKRELSRYGYKGQPTPDKEMARKMAGKISGFLRESDSTGAYGQLMEHYSKMTNIANEIDSWDASKLARQYKGIDPTKDNEFHNSMVTIDNYFKSEPVKQLLQGRNTDYLTGDMIDKYHVYQTLANPQIYGLSHIYPLRVGASALIGSLLSSVGLGPMGYVAGGIAGWNLSSPNRWVPLLKALTEQKTPVRAIKPITTGFSRTNKK